MLDMAMFDFGALRNSLDSKGNARVVGEVALHVQCPWRIAREDEVIVGSCDLYYPADYEGDGGAAENFDWERNVSRQDKLLESFFQNGTRQFIVRDVAVGAAASLHVALSDGFFLDLLPVDSLSIEAWRLFQPDIEHSHFVVTGKGIARPRS